MIPPDQSDDVFNIFHDGTIESALMIDGDCRMHVSIKYLAERISPELDGFDILIRQPSEFHLDGWMREFSKGTSSISSFEDIFSEDLEILCAKIENGRVMLSCNIHDFESELCGGTLSFRNEGAIVTDAMNRSYSLDELDQLCKEYWDDWASKNNKA